MNEEYTAWFRQAEADLKKAKILFENRAYDGVASNCQQAIEKSLKSVIIKNEKKLIRTHDLVFLGKKAKLPNSLLKEMRDLATLHIDARYGITGDIIPAEKFKEEDAVEFLKISEEVIKWAKNKI